MDKCVVKLKIKMHELLAIASIRLYIWVCIKKKKRREIGTKNQLNNLLENKGNIKFTITNTYQVLF